MRCVIPPDCETTHHQSLSRGRTVLALNMLCPLMVSNGHQGSEAKRRQKAEDRLERRTDWIALPIKFRFDRLSKKGHRFRKYYSARAQLVYQ